jgi:endogenous inhibitor of DNA gyrase (YacG/DUF329 family)
VDKPKGQRIILYTEATCPACGKDLVPGDKVVWVRPTLLGRPGDRKLKDPGGCYCLGCADGELMPDKKPKRPSPKSEGERIMTMFEAVCPGCGGTVPKGGRAVWFPSKGKVQDGIFCMDCVGEIE